MALHLVRTDIALLAAALAVPGFSHATVRVVANCNDSGAVACVPRSPHPRPSRSAVTSAIGQ